MINDRISINNACFDGLVGIKDCSKEFDYFIDDYGFSLLKASKQTDEAYGNGKSLVNTIIAQSIQDVIDDIKFDDYQANKILSDISYGKSDSTTQFTGNSTIQFSLNDSLKLGSFYVSTISVFVKTAGTLILQLIENGIVTEIVNGSVVVGENQFVIKRLVSDDFSVKVETQTAVLYNSIIESDCNCVNNDYYSVTDTNGLTSGINVSFQVRCDKVRYLCKYTDLLAKAIIYKFLGKAYFQHWQTSAFNNYINSTNKEDLIAKMVYFDSEYINLTQTERNPNEKIGQYQIELAKLNARIPKPECTSCLSCDSGGGWSINNFYL